jgi:hypothetical protein
MTANDQGNDGQDGAGEKLYAGKFKTLEELEAGYKNSAVVYDENVNLKKKVDELVAVPDAYLNPSDVDLDAQRLTDIQARAKEAGMTQAQYEKFVRSDKQRLDVHQQNFEKAKKELGDESLNILTDYVNKNYPKELHENLLRSFIVNKEARTAALNHRSQLLNNQVPGLNKPAQGGYNVTQKDVNEAYAAKEKNPHDMKARQAYLNILAAQAEQRNAG